MNKFNKVLYSNLTEEKKKAILKHFRRDRSLGGPIGVSISHAARKAFNLTDRQWNGKTGANAFATTLTFLLMEKEIDSEIFS